MIYLYYSDRFSEYNFGPHHPLRPVRLALAYRLMEDYGLLDEGDVQVVEPPLASELELLSVHTPEYLEAVRSEMPNILFGLGIGDNPVFEGIYDASRLVAGGSIDAARRIAEEGCVAFNFAGGLHHAMPDRASGFCIFNDPALAIRTLRRKFGRVLYIDIDAHHGDGVQKVFYDDPRVLTVSIHESGRHLFPGTGFVDELGEETGFGYSVNIPLPPGSGDREYERAFEAIVPPLFEAFRPEVVVSQLGADAHYADPLADLNLTLSGYGRLVSRIGELKDQYAEGRLLALGGGGYNLGVVPVSWAAALQIMKGEEVREYLPPFWAELFKNEVGGSPLCPPDRGPVNEVQEDGGRRRRISEDLDRTLGDLRARLAEVHPRFRIIDR
ncbi:acetoin utilization protein AcuC [Methanocrinis sp.]|uniref:acetoin utilization protein AcuC n=1 Tax=Methanocrinis sp. TaxID=3101522 RepID=UPI003D1396EE